MHMDFNNLPNSFIIGAAKSGTTSLFEIIAEHPAVFASKKKELNFFSNDERYEKGVDWYQTHFSESAAFPVRLEASPAYLAWSEKTAPRIKELYGERPIKIIAIFRNPVTRAYSNYWHRVRMGHEKLSFDEAIDREDQRLKDNWEKLYRTGNPLYGYIRGGRYASRLKPFLDLFPRKDFFFLLQDDLQNDFETSIKKLFGFLGINPQVSAQPVVRNDSTIPRNKGLHDVYGKFKQTSTWQNRMRNFIPKAVRAWVRYKLVVKPFHYPAMDNGIKTRLTAKFADEVAQLELILGRDLSRWQENKLVSLNEND